MTVKNNLYVVDNYRKLVFQELENFKQLGERKMLANIFESHGEFCAKHPWEVIVGVLTLAACMLSVDSSAAGTGNAYSAARMEETNAVDIIFMTIIRCIAVLYTYYQFCKLRKLGSNYILCITGFFTLFSSFVFSCTVINLLRTDVSDLKDALFFFVLVIDLSKASVLAQFALNSSNLKEVNKNIGKGMALLGPTITLDTLVGTLVISVGTLSGVRRLEMLCGFACFSFVVNYFVFMTFYPACLSLVLELSRWGSSDEGKCFEVKKSLMELLYDEGHKPNPVVQRVKVIMSAGMMIVHAHSRWSLNNMESSEVGKMFPVVNGNRTHPLMRDDADATFVQGYFMRFLAMSIEYIIILILSIALTVKCVLFDNREDLSDQILEAKKLEKCKNLYVKMNRGAEEKFSQTEKLDLNLSDTSSQTDIKGAISSDNLQRVQNESIQMQTNMSYADFEMDTCDGVPFRSIKECADIYKQQGSAEKLTNKEICELIKKNIVRARELETVVDDPVRGIGIRRMYIGESGNFQKTLRNLPYQNYDYTKVMGACCENVVGYIPVPIGIAGPLLMDGKLYYVPMATTEGCLIASTNRGTRAILDANGVISRVVADGMTRGPVVKFRSLESASEALLWIESPENFKKLKERFDSTSRFARLQRVLVRIVGSYLFIRFSSTTGDAMGMNMISKGTEAALEIIKENFKDMSILSLSGNFCTDKKPSAVNWIEGRGKGVVCEAVIPERIVKGILKTTAQAMVEANISKNLIGSAVAGSIGGFNAHAANIVTAIYIATGQDPAQNVCSSNCMTIMETRGETNNDLYISCSMPSIEIGTVGGGTNLPAQSACLEMLGVKGPDSINPGDNAKKLARIVCSTVLAGELSLMASLTAGTLVQSHLTYNRTSHSVRTVEANVQKPHHPVLNDKIIGTCISC